MFFKTLFPGLARKRNKIYSITLYNRNYEVIGVVTGKDKKQLENIASWLQQYMRGTNTYSLN